LIRVKIMTKKVTLTLNGDLTTKFNVNLKITDDYLTHKEQVKGNDGILINSEAVFESFNQWCDRYQEITSYVGKTWRFEILNPEVNPEDNKQQAFKRCQEAGNQLICELNHWLNQTEFQPVRDALKKYLTDRSERVRILLETDNLILRQLPWQEWDFLKQELKLESLEIALSSSNFEKVSEPKKAIEKVKVLAVLGSKVEIKSQKEAINKLQDESHAQITWVESNQREKLKQLLLEEAWDIFFFAGHGETTKDAKTGRILINEAAQDWLTITELKTELNTAIQQKKRLKLAIISACSGLGLAYQLGEGEKLYLPQIIVMKNELPVKIAPVFLRYFLEEYTEGKSLYQAVQFARQELQKLEKDYPYASWLPIIVQNQGEIPPRWVELGGISTCQPYRGLNTFQEEDAPFFFGRERFTEKLFRAIKTKSFLAIVGASGSGKSSMVYAGLIPFLKASNQYTIINFRPKNSPFVNLAEAVLSLFSEQNLDQLVNTLKDENLGISQLAQDLIQTQQKHLLLIIDQFEEVYTLVRNEKERLEFINTILKAVKTLERVTVLITLRGDFYGQAIENPELAEYLQNNCFNLSQMTKDELESAIIKPAELLEIGLERGLKELLINAIGFNEDQENQPQLLKSNLPLLSFTLALLWQSQRESLLTTSAYNQIGGLRNCLNQYAEKIYQKLTPNEQKRAEKILIQLVQFNNETEDTRRIATKKQIGESNWDLVQKLADQRLIVTNFNPNTREETAEIVHEILIKSWQTLRNWLEQNRDFRIWQQRLRDAHRFYQLQSTKKTQEKALLKDLFLAQSLNWLNQRPEDLTQGERDFINQSKTYSDRQTRNTILSLTGGIIFALILAGFATYQSIQRQKALIAEEQAKIEADTQRINYEITSSSRLSKNLLTSNQNLEALTEALRGARQLQKTNLKINADTRSQVILALQQAFYNTREFNRIEGFVQEVIGVEFSPDGQFFASASKDNAIKLWNLKGELIKTLQIIPQITSEQINPQEIGGGGINQFSLSPDGKIISVGAFTFPPINYYDNYNPLDLSNHSQEIQLWNIDEGKLIRTFKGHQISVEAVKFSPDGKLIASGSYDKTVKIWTIDGKLLKTLQNDFLVEDIAFSPDGKMIVSVGDQTIKLWSIDGTFMKTLSGHNTTIQNVVFSPDGKTIASRDSNGFVKLWNLEGKEMKTLDTQEQTAFTPSPVVFSPDGKMIATGSKKIKLWKSDGTLITVFDAHNTPIYDLSFSPDGKILASAGGQEQVVKLWSVKANFPLTLPTGANQFTFSPDAKTLAIARVKIITLWNRQGQLLKTLEGHQETINDLSFSPDGQTLASVSGYDDTLGILLDFADVSLDENMKIIPNSQNQDLPEERAENLLKRASERTQKNHDRSIKLWNINDGQLIKNIDVTIKDISSHQGHQFGARSVNFTPDGKLLVSTGMEYKSWTFDGAYGTLIENFVSQSNNMFSDVDFTSDGKKIAIAVGKDIEIHSRIDNSQPTILKGHEDDILAINFSPDNSMIVSTSFDQTAKIWKTDGTLITTLDQFKGNVIYAIFTPDNQKVITAGNDGITIWDLAGQKLAEFGGKTEVTNERVVGINYDKNEDQTLTISKVYPNSPAKKAGLKNGDIILAVDNQSTKNLSLDEANELIGGESGTKLNLTIARKNRNSFDVSITRQKRKYTETVPISYTCVNFSPDGQTIVSADADHKVKLWTLDGKLLKTFTGHQETVYKAIFSPDGQTIASASFDKTVKLWTLDGQLIETLDHGNAVHDIEFSPDGELLASASADSMVRIWKKDGTFVKPLLGNIQTDISGNAKTISFKPDGKSLVLGNDNDIEFWNLEGNLFRVLADQIRVCNVIMVQKTKL
jgi:WD40 repeat protein